MADAVPVDPAVARSSVSKIRVLGLSATYEYLDADENRLGVRHIRKTADELPAGLLTTIETQAKADVVNVE